MSAPIWEGSGSFNYHFLCLEQCKAGPFCSQARQALLKTRLGTCMCVCVCVYLGEERYLPRGDWLIPRAHGLSEEVPASSTGPKEMRLLNTLRTECRFNRLPSFPPPLPLDLLFLKQKSWPAPQAKLPFPQIKNKLEGGRLRIAMIDNWSLQGGEECFHLHTHLFIFSLVPYDPLENYNNSGIAWVACSQGNASIAHLDCCN